MNFYDPSDVLGNMFKLTGLIVWVLIALIFAYYILFELVIVGLANTFSYLRWEYRCSVRRRYIKSPTWFFKNFRTYSRHFFCTWFQMWGYRDGCRTYRAVSGGIWLGISNWELSPIADKDPVQPRALEPIPKPLIKKKLPEQK